jgi:fermentation-respiration switch protein FrsA (DUF1100 family)
LGAYPIGVFVSSSRRPLLVVHGTQDFISVEQGKRIYDEAAGRKEWVLLEGGNHVCNNMPFRCRPLIGDFPPGTWGQGRSRKFVISFHSSSRFLIE